MTRATARNWRIPRSALLTIAVLVTGCFTLSPATAHALADRPIQSDAFDQCLKVGSPAHNGTGVQLTTCNGDVDQSWTWYNDGQIRSSVDGRCLDLDLNSRGPDGTPYRVQVWDCHGGTNQQWKDGWAHGQILTAYSDRALQADRSVTEPGAIVVGVWPASTDLDNQYWSCDCRVPYPSRW